MPSNFIFILHFHQPHGQLKYVNERIYENSYKMLLDVFKEYSDLKFTVHISGPLLLYLKDQHPEWLEEIFRLGDIGTLEFMAGTISESILPLVPSKIRVQQVVRYIEIFERLSGIKPRGFWLPERVWEPWIPEVLAKSGLEYVVIDDATLRKTGHSVEKTKYAWITEESGYSIKVLFIDEKLRYILPWEHPDKVIEYIASFSHDPSALLLWGSDAEKFGEWWDRESSRAWLRDFLGKLRFEKRISTIHPVDYLREHGVRGLVYLDTGSYDKMLEWSNGFFRNFLVKYPESNNMHKKALWVLRKLERAGYAEKAPLDYLMAYCNDAYWHGLFGGIYLAHLRQAIYESLIKTEREVEEKIEYYNSNGIKRILVDFDQDGLDELLIETPLINLYIKPSDGGTLFEFDYKRREHEHNIQDTMTRYREPYLEGSGLNPDWYRRVSWRLHIWSHDTSIHDWMYNTPFKDISNIALLKFNTVFSDNPFITYLRGIGGVYSYGHKIAEVFVEKRVEVLPHGYNLRCSIKNMGDGIVQGKIGIEYHLAWKIDRDHERSPWYTVNGHVHDISNWYTGRGSLVKLHSPRYPQIILKSSSEKEIWIARLVSYARTEKGLREIPQGLGVMFVDNIELKRNDTHVFEIEHIVEA